MNIFFPLLFIQSIKSATTARTITIGSIRRDSDTGAMFPVTHVQVDPIIYTQSAARAPSLPIRFKKCCFMVSCGAVILGTTGLVIWSIG